MMDIDKIKQRILDLAIRGKLVAQDPNDEPASVLIEKIKAEKEKMIKEGKIKPSKDDSYIYKASDNCYYEKIPNGWTLVKLKEVISLKSGMDLTLSEINTNSDGIPYLTGASCFVDDGLLVNRWTNIPKTISHKNDLLITVKGTIGELAFNNIGEIHIARQIMSLTINKEIEPQFIFFYLLVNKEKIIQKNASLIPGIKRDDILNLVIALPPKEEQKRIILKINELLNIVKKISNELKAVRDLTFAIKRKTLDYFFGDNSSYKSYYPNYQIKDLCKLDKSDVLKQGLYPYLEAKVIRSKKTPEYIQKGGFIKKGTKIILVDGENSGEVMIAPCDGYLGSTFRILNANEKINDEYLMWFIEYYKKSLKSNRTGSAVPHLNKKIFYELKIPLPPINIQEVVVNKIANFFNQLDIIIS